MSKDTFKRNGGPVRHINPYKDLYPLTRQIIKPVSLEKPHIVWTGGKWMVTPQRFFRYARNKQDYMDECFRNAESFVHHLNSQRFWSQ